MDKKIEVKTISEREIHVNDTRVYLGDDDIIYDYVVGEPTEEIAIAETGAVLKLADLVEGRVNLYVDLNRAGGPGPQARARYRELAQNEKIKRVALSGLHPVARVIASFFIGSLLKKEIKFFRTREEAIAWLMK